MLPLLPPKLTSMETVEFQKLITLHYLSTGTSFSRIECPYFEKALQILRPDVRLPSRRQMSHQLLDDIHVSIKAESLRFMTLPSTFGTISSDGALNVNGDSKTSYNLITGCY